MLEIDVPHRLFVMKEIWFSDKPFDPPNIDSVSFFACREEVMGLGFRKEAFSTLIIDTTQDLEKLWMDLRPSFRQNIKRAEKEGIEIRTDESHSDFCAINDSFRSSKQLWQQSYSVDYLRRNGVLFTMRYEGETLGGIFFLKDDRNMYGKVMATKRLQVDEGTRSIIGLGNRLMMWEALKHAKTKGVIRFDLGGIYTGQKPDPQQEAIKQFKLGFGGHQVNVFTYRKDYSFQMKLMRRYENLRNQLYIKLNQEKLAND
jgi:hypothetical protein